MTGKVRDLICLLLLRYALIRSFLVKILHKTDWKLYYFQLPHIGNRASDVRKFLNLQLERLQMNYVDLYLIHVPFAFKCDPNSLTPTVKETGDYELDMDTNHGLTWQVYYLIYYYFYYFIFDTYSFLFYLKVMEECQKEGLIRNLGLSNFNEKQIENIIKNTQLKPQVLQVELHAYFQQLQLRKFCKDNNIVLTAYAPLGSPGAKTHFVTKYKYRYLICRFNQPL